MLGTTPFLLVVFLVLTQAALGDETNGKFDVLFKGFDHEPVQFFVGQKEVYSSALSTGSPTFTIDAVFPLTDLTIRVPRLKITKVVDLDWKKGAYLHMALKNDHLSLIQTRENPLVY
jgi:hypothetical protein